MIIPLFNIHYGNSFLNNINPVRGTLWYDTSANTLRIFNGTQWEVVATGGGSGGGSGFGGNTIASGAIRLVTQATYTVDLNDDFLIFFDANSNDITVNIPNGSNGRMLLMKRIDNSNTRTVTLNGQIDNLTSITLDPQEYKFFVFYSNSWRVLGS